MNSRLTSRPALLSLIMLLVSLSPAKADTIVDQSNITFPLQTMVFQNVQVFSPFGQSFTPTLSSLNFVNLLTESGNAAAFALELNIRSGTISGPILGSSQPTTVIPGSSPFVPIVTPLVFSVPVTLVPGDLYVIEVLQVSGQPTVASTSTNNYPGGTQILSGVPQTNNDLWFQEGISVPEPSTLLLLGIGLIGLCNVFLAKDLSWKSANRPSPY